MTRRISRQKDNRTAKAPASRRGPFWRCRQWMPPDSKLLRKMIVLRAMPADNGVNVTQAIVQHHWGTPDPMVRKMIVYLSRTGRDRRGGHRPSAQYNSSYSPKPMRIRNIGLPDDQWSPLRMRMEFVRETIIVVIPFNKHDTKYGISQQQRPKVCRR